jgi:hypothetical protein
MNTPSPVSRVATCACHNLAITLKGEPARVSSCNCTACQRRTGSVFGVAAYFAEADIVSQAGNSKVFERKADSDGIVSMHFYPDCGTTVYWRLTMYPDHLGLAVGCFADPGFPAPERTVWASCKHHWVQFPPSIRVYPKTP